MAGEHWGTQICLETAQLILRCVTEAGIDNLVDLDRDPEVRRCINGRTPTLLDVFEHEVLSRFLGSF